MDEYIPIISVVIALFAVIIGPFVTLYIARRQIKANVLSPNRQQWINTLRDEISNYLAIMARTASATAGRVGDQEYIRTCIEDLCCFKINCNELLHNYLLFWDRTYS